MKKIIVSWADEKMSKSLSVCIRSAFMNGCDVQFETAIGYEFKKFNEEIFDQERGCGYWLWKPYIINAALEMSEPEDIIIYSDAGIEFIGNIQPVINAMDNDIMLFSNGWTHIHWCKMDVIRAINGLNGFITHDTQAGHFIDCGDYDQHKQVQASNIIIKNTEFSRRFVKEWLLYCQMPGFIDDSPSVLPNHPEFAEHRHDQAVLSCLQIKYQIRQHWFPSTTNLHKRNDFGDLYNPIFNHHRKRNNEW